MTKKNAGDAAKAGFYFNAASWELDLHRTDGAALPGNPGDVLVRVPAMGLLVLGPAMGFLFVVFLPFIGFALVAREMGHRMAGWFGWKNEIEAEATVDHR